MVIDTKFVDWRGNSSPRPKEGASFSRLEVKIHSIIMLPDSFARVVQIEERFRKGLRAFVDEFNRVTTPM